MQAQQHAHTHGRSSLSVQEPCAAADHLSLLADALRRGATHPSCMGVVVAEEIEAVYAELAAARLYRKPIPRSCGPCAAL